MHAMDLLQPKPRRGGVSVDCAGDFDFDWRNRWSPGNAWQELDGTDGTPQFFTT